ncbi:hypothetical protein ACGFZR_15330 [Streptomyces sp. NPDC048241]|uniref:hypothetical protein n=1 Tax=Streptomyces sp. NPDC048241 TaxID=3365521 RepID=UPI00371A6DB1
MTDLTIQADDFQIGDRVHRAEGDPITVRRIDRGAGGILTVNEGDTDAMHGFAWQHATVTRTAV